MKRRIIVEVDYGDGHPIGDNVEVRIDVREKVGPVEYAMSNILEPFVPEAFKSHEMFVRHVAGHLLAKVMEAAEK